MSAEPTELPIWARSEAFPAADDGWGWVDKKGNRTACESLDRLSQAIIDDAGARVDLVWTPASPHLVLPEEIGSLQPALKEARVRWAKWEIGEGLRQMAIFGGITAAIAAYTLIKGEQLIAFGPLGLALLLFLILGFIPWYQGRKRLGRARDWMKKPEDLDLPGLRFEIWMQHQKAPFTKIILGLLGIVALVQLLNGGSYLDRQDLQAAALLKSHARPTDWWRLATAPFLHGHWLHFLLNASALAYLGRRVELLCGWPHMLLVLVFSAWMGGEATARFVAGPSVGASGGIIGLLGFLMIFESMHAALVPQGVRRRLFAGAILTAAIGWVGYRFIDNWAHAGGLVGGMLYAFIVFPSSSSASRPKQTTVDVILGWTALCGVGLAAVWTALLLISQG